MKKLLNWALPLFAALLVLLILMNWNWVDINGTGIQAIATVVLVCITGFYAVNTREMAVKTKDMAEATKIMAREQKEQNEREKDIKAIVYFIQMAKRRGRTSYPISGELFILLNLKEERFKELLPYLTGPSDPLIIWESSGVSSIRLKDPREYQPS